MAALASLPAAGFSYDGMDKDDRGKLVSLAATINSERRKHAVSCLAMGEAIAHAHAILSKDGPDSVSFSQWVETECLISRSTAYRYMYAWQRFGEAELQELQCFTVEALIDLSSKSCPEKASKEALKLAKKGSRINAAVAKQLIEQYTFQDKPAAKLPAPVSGPAVWSGPSVANEADEASSEPLAQPDAVLADAAASDPPFDVPEAGEQAVPVGKLISKANEMVGHLVRLIGDINNAKPNGKYKESCLDSLSIVLADLDAWRNV
jgi:hypothetical protein